MEKAILSVFVLGLLVVGGCGVQPDIQSLGILGTTLLTKEINNEMPDDLKLSNAQEEAWGQATYIYFEKAYEKTKDLLETLTDED